MLPGLPRFCHSSAAMYYLLATQTKEQKQGRPGTRLVSGDNNTWKWKNGKNMEGLGAFIK